jgi:dihydrofolate synthase/folylpolyglutamate synthase
LDSTNIVEPEITSITSIGYDHVDFLGPTLDDIALQKAGIIKPGKPIVINMHNAVIEKIAQEKQAPLLFTDKVVSTNLIGDHQKKNASLAYEICRYLGVPESIILQ